MSLSQFKPTRLSLVISALIFTASAQAAELTKDQKNLAEYLKQPQQAIGLSAEIANKYNGNGVKVGVVDSGFFNQHGLLKDKRNIIPLPFTATLNGQPYRFDPTKLSDEKDQESGKQVYSTHGGQVSGIIVANALKSTIDPRLNYFGGIAKEATLYQVSYEPTTAPPSSGQPDDKKLLLGKDPLSRMTFSAAIDNLLAKTSNLSIMNHSWNEDPASEQAAGMDREYKGKLDLSNVLVNSLHRATQQGVLQVFAAGNESKKQPGIMAALPRYFPEMEKHYLSVIAVGADHKLESYSNHCGISKNWCIAAPGTMVLLALKGDPKVGTTEYTFSVEQGTSYAAPTISGVAALLKQRFEYMSMSQVRDVMLTTATDLGAKGVDDTFGWGMVNVSKALNGPAQLLGDERYTLNRDDSWSNAITAGGRLTKLGSGKLTLTGEKNQLKGITLAGGGLTLQGETRLTESAVVDQGNLHLNSRLQASELQVNRAGSLSGNGIVDAATSISGKLKAGGMTFLNALNLQPSAQLELVAAEGIIADGKAAQVRLNGQVTTDRVDFSEVKAGQTVGRVLSVKNGADYHGGFSALAQPQGLLAQNLRYDLQFNPNEVLLTINSSRLTASVANRNEASALNALNQLRDSRLAFSRSSYNRWLTQALQSGDWQGLQGNLGNSIYANSVRYLLDQAGLNRTLLHSRLFAAKALKTGEWQVWSESARDNSHDQANYIGKRVDYRAKQQVLGVSKSLSERTLISAAVAKNRIEVEQTHASAKIDEVRLSAAARYYPLVAAQGWFVEGDLSWAKLNYKQQRHFNGVADSAKGDSKGWNANAGLSLGYLWQPNAWTLEPSIGFELNRLSLKGFNERGSDLALSNQKVQKTEADLVLDVKLERRFQLADWQLMPSVSLGYLHHLAKRPITNHSRLADVEITQTATAEQRTSLRTELAVAARYHAWQVTLGWQHNGYKQQKGNKAYLNIGYQF